MVAMPSPAVPSRDPYGRGRPSVLTPAVQTAILGALAQGHKRKAACALAGITYQTFLNRQTEAKENACSEFRDFFDQVTQAEEHGRAVIASRVLAATEIDWRAGMKWLAVVDPDEYSEQRQIRMIHEGSVQHTHVHTLALPDTESFTALAGLLGLPDDEPTDTTATEIP